MVDFTLTQGVPFDNVFTIEIAPGGDFTGPVITFGSVSAGASVQCRIVTDLPQNLLENTDYKIRIKGSNPAAYSPANQYFFQVKRVPPFIPEFFPENYWRGTFYKWTPTTPNVILEGNTQDIFNPANYLGYVTDDALSFDYNNLKIRLILSSTLIAMHLISFAQTYSQVWADEFDNLPVATSNWKFETGTGQNGWGNNELQYYTNRPLNATILNGKLLIIGRKESFGGSNYTSARLKTQGLQSWKYGKIEARMKLPKGQGIWSAFWMLGQNIGQLGWPRCGEIDIMERINNENAVHGTIHWDANGHQYYGNPSGSLGTAGYHVYSIEWNTTGIRWLMDGVQYGSANTTNSINGTEEFHSPFFILFNLAIGGNWPGNPNASTVFPDTMHVDYVRVHQQISSNEEVRSAAPALRMAPNPVGDMLVIQSQDMAIGKEICISDFSGRIVHRQVVSSTQVSLPAAHFKPGFYRLFFSEEPWQSICFSKD